MKPVEKTLHTQKTAGDDIIARWDDIDKCTAILHFFFIFFLFVVSAVVFLFFLIFLCLQACSSRAEACRPPDGWLPKAEHRFITVTEGATWVSELT